MAKAKEITGLDCGADVLEWADEVLRVRFEEILDKRAAALQTEDIEGVHDMRVATRRLRSAMRDFAPLMTRKPLKKVKKDLKRIADALGAARDEDVAIVALEKLRGKTRSKNIKSGIEDLIAERRGRREQAQINLLENISADALEELKGKFEKAVDAAARRKKSDREISFNQAGHKVVGKSVEEFCALSDHIYEPFIDEPLHELRIAAKRLRYAIELYTTCWGEHIVLFAKGIAEMQGFLGEVHDADVWLADLSRTLKNSKDENQANIWLLSEFVEKRTKNYRAALKLWSDWREHDFIEKFKTIVSRTDF